MPAIQTIDRSGDDPEPPWRAPCFIGFFVTLVLIGLIVPVWFGHPLRSKTVYLYCDAKSYGDCEVDRAVNVLRKVYGSRTFCKRQKPENDRGCGGDGARIDIVVDHITGPAHSWLENGCRFVGIDLNDPSFTSHTLAHEFGHQRFGDVGLTPGILTPLLNMVYDMRNDLIITYGL
jgi:hypothetical protein